jgi:hypothetical protein
MFDSNILEVGIGLVFVYLLCSLACSAINESISRLFDLRASALQARIADLLNNKKLAKMLYAHPLITGVTRRTLLDRVLRRYSKPSYISPKIFSTALSDVLIKSAGTAEIKIGRDNSIYRRKMLVDLERGINKLENDKTGHILRAIVDSAKTETDRIEDAIAKVRQEFEEWFDDAVAQLSAWYKQKARFIIFLIALIVSAGFNIDTIMIARGIYQQKALRDTFVTAAAELSKKEADAELKTDSPVEIAEELANRLSKLGLPIGWDFDQTTEKVPTGLPVGTSGVIFKIIGIFLTTLAIAMGTPFWFGLLRQMVAVKKWKLPEKGKS